VAERAQAKSVQEHGGDPGMAVDMAFTGFTLWGTTFGLGLSVRLFGRGSRPGYRPGLRIPIIKPVVGRVGMLMQDGNIEISSTGFKFSYLRYLADGAAGLFLLLLLAVGYYADLPIVGQEVTFRGFFAGRMDVHAKVFFLVAACL
jgi:hypothetical protein